MSENTAAHGPVRDENAIIKRSKPLTDSTTTTTRQLRKQDAKVSGLAPAASLGPSQASTIGPTTTRQALTNVTNTSTATSRIHTTTKVQTRSKTAAAASAAAASTVKDNDNKDKPRVGTKRSATQLDEQTDVKRSKTEQEWEDLDKFDLDDPLMVCEYVNDIFEYFSRLEISTLPDPKYLEWQKGLKPKMRSILVDWIVEVHLRFRLLPETLFLAINIMDRFMSKETVQVDKLQLLATGSLFIAAKYEEVYSPSVKNYSYVTDGGYTEEDILNAERYILQVLEFDLSYPNPMNFLRRISKADDYDIETRTVGKYLLEISIMDHRFIGIKPSLCAAAAMYLSRRMLGRSPWNKTLIHYSGGYTKSDMKHVIDLLMKYLIEPVAHEEFFKKYASKKYMKSSILARQWAKQVEAEKLDVMSE